jgi:hypothetical protein
MPATLANSEFGRGSGWYCHHLGLFSALFIQSPNLAYHLIKRQISGWCRLQELGGGGLRACGRNRSINGGLPSVELNTHGQCLGASLGDVAAKHYAVRVFVYAYAGTTGSNRHLTRRAANPENSNVQHGRSRVVGELDTTNRLPCLGWIGRLGFRSAGFFQRDGFGGDWRIGRIGFLPARVQAAN